MQDRENRSESRPDDFVLGGQVDRVEVSLRIVGPTLVPGRITHRLGVDPTFAAQKGDLVDRGGTRIKQNTGIWTYALAQSVEWELDDAIRTLLSRFPDNRGVWRELAQDFRIDLFCGLFLASRNRGTELSPETMLLLAHRHARLGLDIYAVHPSDV